LTDIGETLAAYLDTQGYGEWKNASPALNTIFRDELPDMPANCIGIWINNGQSPDHYTGGAIEHPIADLIIRNTSKATARSTAEAIRQHFLLSAHLGGDSLFEATAGSYPVYLGKDDSNRYKFSVSIELTLDRL
jgi:hypothetical protein